MPTYTITHACGHRVEHKIDGPTEQRRTAAAGRMGAVACLNCRNNLLYKLGEKQAAEARKNGWAALRGGPNEVAHANIVRMDRVQEIDDWTTAAHRNDRDLLRSVLLRQTDARAWLRTEFLSVWDVFEKWATAAEKRKAIGPNKK